MLEFKARAFCVLSTGLTSELATHHEEVDLIEKFPRYIILTEQGDTRDHAGPHQLAFPDAVHTVKVGHWPFSVYPSVLLDFMVLPFPFYRCSLDPFLLPVTSCQLI